MHGNVCEWCRDVYAKVASKDYDPPEGPPHSNHVVRGGSWGRRRGLPVGGPRIERDSATWGTVGFRLACRRVSPTPR